MGRSTSHLSSLARDRDVGAGYVGVDSQQQPCHVLFVSGIISKWIIVLRSNENYI
jgi:hypothetical protein